MNYQVSSDGTIFSIQGDDSIKQVAKIDENGNITTLKRGGNTNSGNTIYSGRTMYLKPQNYYKGFAADNYELKIKWFRPNGSMSTGASSPYGYSQSDCHSLSDGSNSIELPG